MKMITQLIFVIYFNRMTELHNVKHKCTKQMYRALHQDMHHY